MTRSRAAQLKWRDAPELELRLAGLEGPAPEPSWSTAPVKERAAVLGRQPVWLLLGALQRDESFLGGLEGVVAGSESTAALAARYQRRSGYGRAVMHYLIELAVQRAVREFSERDLSPAEQRVQFQAAFVLPMAVLYWDEPIASGDRQRWRSAGWRSDAVATLLALGAGRCLEPGCEEGAERRYCYKHADRERKPPESFPTNLHKDTAKHNHDLAMARVSDLLGEVGSLLHVPKING